MEIYMTSLLISLTILLAVKLTFLYGFLRTAPAMVEDPVRSVIIFSCVTIIFISLTISVLVTLYGIGRMIVTFASAFSFGS